uniref:Saposin B-type domain-containing protein n=1 Tax=Steinernema glaseri TaxID=37863 RepID=A0A1I7ZDY5_9BILA
MKLLLALLFVVGFVSVTDASIFCESCLSIVQFMASEFKKNGWIHQDSDKVCDLVTLKIHFLNNICHKILDGSLDEIEKLLKEGEDAGYICRFIKFC